MNKHNQRKNKNASLERSWFFKRDDGGGLTTDIDIFVGPSGIVWQGESNFPSGGEYRMGEQSLDSFLNEIPAVDTPLKIVDEIRKHILKNKNCNKD